ncbi:TPA: hypothetical protein MCL96_004753 [Klebsiella pneumoniae]|uniref:hypothetical protein n=1 Tax=Klebsiella pneumoniae TaxID=573 RepID=UPI000B13D555|nr:hypothetical protein [Klebsiella pneumoniae]HBS9937624.1 hypothetical protein [Klebsiella pneumoniae]HBT8843362.1 hypothetical protein [Klebsiella pneumoniae]
MEMTFQPLVSIGGASLPKITTSNVSVEVAWSAGKASLTLDSEAASGESLLASHMMAYNDAEILAFQSIQFELGGIMNSSLSGPLTLGWALSIATALFVSALGIAAGTYSLIHDDINDVRSDVNAVRDGASQDTSDLRKDMRQDYAQLGSKLDKMNDTLTSIKIEAAKNSK